MVAALTRVRWVRDRLTVLVVEQRLLADAIDACADELQEIAAAVRAARKEDDHG